MHRISHDAWMGDGPAAATIADVRAALSLYRIVCEFYGASWLSLHWCPRGDEF
jgi:hypothetical protein